MRNYKMVGMEAIAFQGKDLYQTLSKIIAEWRLSKKFENGNSFAQAMSAAISEYTGISTIIDVSPYPMANAFVEIPQLDKNNPIINNMFRIGHTNNDLRKLNKVVGDTFNGLLDFEKGRVYGDFTKMVVPIFITSGLLADEDITEDEVSAIVCHELGHIWSLYESLRDIVSCNIAAVTVANRLMGMTTPQERIKLIHECAEVVDVNAKELETIADETKKEVIYTHIVSTALRNRRNVEGDETYSYRGFEFASDQYATRMGAGPSLASALAKIERKAFLNSTYMNWPMHIMLEILKVTGTMALSLIIPLYGVLTAITLLVARPLDQIYDDPKERLQRIRRELISRLKTDMSPAERKSTVSDLAAIEAIYNDMSPKSDWLTAVWKYVIPSGRTIESKKAFQQSIERLANNELFVATAKIEGL